MALLQLICYSVLQSLAYLSTCMFNDANRLQIQHQKIAEPTKLFMRKTSQRRVLSLIHFNCILDPILWRNSNPERKNSSKLHLHRKATQEAPKVYLKGTHNFLQRLSKTISFSLFPPMDLLVKHIGPPAFHNSFFNIFIRDCFGAAICIRHWNIFYFIHSVTDLQSYKSSFFVQLQPLLRQN